MTGVVDTGPLDWRIAIVGKDGRPTPEFQRRWTTQRGNNSLIGAVTLGTGIPPASPAPADGAEYVNIATTPYTVFLGNGGTWHQVGAVAFTDLSDVPHVYATHGLALLRVKTTEDGVEFVTQSASLDSLGTPASGQLLQRGASVWALVTISTVLDVISSTRGTVLFRGASAWSALAPGTSGNVLTTAGAGADPTWAAAGGGGGGALAVIGDQNPNNFQTPSVNFYIATLISVPANITINKIGFRATSATPTCTYRPFAYPEVGGVPSGSLLASGVQVTGVTVGYNEAPFSAPLALTKGQLVWLGANVTGAAITNLWHNLAGRAAFVGNGGSNTPAGTAPAFGASTTAGNIYGFFGVV